MTDFIQYVVSELQAKRLSKQDALSLLEQFSARANTLQPCPKLHPLVHINTSDLHQQSYVAHFDGSEFFLADHRLALGSGDAVPVMPGVAYLEMIRAAVTLAGDLQAGGQVRLSNHVWLQPMVIADHRQAHIVLVPNGDGELAYEVYTQAAGRAGEEILHCQGLAQVAVADADESLDLEAIRARMQRGRLGGESIYQAYRKLGLHYGIAHQAIDTLLQGDGEVLAAIELRSASSSAEDFVLHPALADAAVQAAIGMAASLDDVGAQANLPFALDSAVFFKPCAAQMFAWVRFAPGHSANSPLLKLDIDLCNGRGEVCARLTGFSSRVLVQSPPVSEDVLFARPQWLAKKVQASRERPPAVSRVVFSFSDVLDEPLINVVDHVSLAGYSSVSAQYTAASGYLLAQLQRNLTEVRDGPHLLQVAVVGADSELLFSGLGGMLKTASQENVWLRSQLLLCENGSQLAAIFDENVSAPDDALIRYRQGLREIRQWFPCTGNSQARVPFREHGTYLITGGTGGLGLKLARQILQETGHGKVVLTGRSALDDGKRARLATLPDGAAGRVIYRQLDLLDAGQTQRVVADLAAELGPLAGILHCAGTLADNYILKKSLNELNQVLAPKVQGTLNLDMATAAMPLDFFVLFSSLSAVLGNPGQADYAAANGFMDGFATYREQQVERGLRAGKSLSINWPLWQDGGMQIAETKATMLREDLGISLLSDQQGMSYFYRALQLAGSQFVVVAGDYPRLLKLFERQPEPVSQQREQHLPASASPSPGGGARMRAFLCGEFASFFKLPAQRIDAEAPLEKYGMDSILAMDLTRQLEKTFGTLPKTLFFEYQTIAALADYLSATYPGKVTPSPDPVTSPPAAAPVANHGGRPARLRDTRRQRLSATPARQTAEPIAVVGLSGRYPMADTLDDFWQNLRDGRDCIQEVPASRWDWHDYYSEDRTQSGRHFSKWGGFINGFDEFDPLFFAISPREAENLDPQERLFLQHAWLAMEDGGFTRESLQMAHSGDLPGQVGVYVGVMYSEYQLHGAEASARGNIMGVPGSFASIANRVSYILNLHGPSMTVDTMCSSSLTCIHLAIQDLRAGRTQLAIAGGVNLSIHANKYLVLSGGQYISSDGHCQSFGEGGDGYIPGEGVGAVVLQTLTEAERQGRPVYALLKGSALNHGGKTHGYSVPNPQAQTSVIRRAMTEAGVEPSEVGYIEAHGTGTRLGDPIEIAALSKAFAGSGASHQCLVGSAKSNIGHCESAAGIAGLTKVLLQMRHRQIVPSLHSAKRNPHIDFESTPFEVNQQLRPWTAVQKDGKTLPRIAGISSFGAGGSNAHLVVEDYVRPAVTFVASAGRWIAPLSARTAEQLEQKVRDLANFLEGNPPDISAVCYTLQLGREAMSERLAFIVADSHDLQQQLLQWLETGQAMGAYRGTVADADQDLALIAMDDDMAQAVQSWVTRQKFDKLMEFWVKGLRFDWQTLYGAGAPGFISLPGYPFAKQRYWLNIPAAPQRAPADHLHPLLHTNISSFQRQGYRSVFSGSECFLRDHQVMLGSAVLPVVPGVACLEMMRAALAHSVAEDPLLRDCGWQLQAVTWLKPLVVSAPTAVETQLVTTDDGTMEVRIERLAEGSRQLHCRAKVVAADGLPTEMPDVAQLKQRFAGDSLPVAQFYEQLRGLGLHYGKTFQTIQQLWRLPGEVFVALDGGAADQLLHPALLDGALQAAFALALESVTSQPVVPFGLDELVVVDACSEGPAFAWIQLQTTGADGQVTLNVHLFAADGGLCAVLRGLRARPLAGNPATATGLLAAVPQWQSLSASPSPLPSFGRREVWCVGELAGRVAALTPLFGPEVKLVGIPLDGIPLDGTPKEGATAAERFESLALQVLALLQPLSTGGRSLVQLVFEEQGSDRCLAGIGGLLQTASAESPLLQTQLLALTPAMATESLAGAIERSAGWLQHSRIRWQGATAQIPVWSEIGLAEDGPSAWVDGGVYLITGGLGGLGQLFARTILSCVNSARIVLTGRADCDQDRRAQCAALGESVEYRRLDLTRAEEVQQLVTEIVAEYGRLSGILHIAGTTRDAMLVQKTPEQLHEVLAPKVVGTVNLDLATTDTPLDFFVLFSSGSALQGNPGQADYAAANGFLDAFAHYRQALVAGGQRTGKTLSINWPLWAEGGMHMAQASRDRLFAASGMVPLQTASAMRGFAALLHQEQPQGLVVEGEIERLRRQLEVPSAAPAAATPLASAPLAQSTEQQDELRMATQQFLRQLFAEQLRMSAAEIDPAAPLERYGMDSVLAMSLTSELEKHLGALAKTLFFEYQTLAQLTAYLVTDFAPSLVELLGLNKPQVSANKPAPIPVSAAVGPVSRDTGAKVPAVFPSKPGLPLGFSQTALQDVAVVGVAGRYPMAANLEQFWRNLADGRDCISEIPPQRWDASAYFAEQADIPGKTRSKWGGFIDDVDKFDALFFNISPREAELIDPQERLFLQTVWHTLEDAGYPRDGLAHLRVGVYVGVMWGQYELFAGAPEQGTPGSSFASIANRVSYYFGFTGPSMALDTMCSSSLTAIHLASEEIRRGEIDAAIAGGVNLSLHPQKYLNLSQGNFQSSDGRCRSFGAGGDGYVPGEGVGAVLLKNLAQARTDGDHIYALIKSSTINHGGKTNGYTVPNPAAQAELIHSALSRAKVSPASISYIEAHGTGTALGDPIEIAGLSKAFGDTGVAGQHCAIGSVKSNIGHLESAAGIAAVTKVLLQFEHRQRVPSLHAEPPNPNIDFAKTPFYVQTALADWQTAHDGQPLRAAVSSFGAGGANANLVLEAVAEPAAVPQALTSPVAFVLSAGDRAALLRQVQQVLAYLDQAPQVCLLSLAYSSQVCRTPLAERLLCIASSISELHAKLHAWAAADTADPAGVYTGSAKDRRGHVRQLVEGQAGDAFVGMIARSGDLAKIAQLWVAGVAINWRDLYTQQPRRIRLPLYPFARDRHWLAPANETPSAAPVTPSPTVQPAVAVAKADGALFYQPVWQARSLPVSPLSGNLLFVGEAGRFFKTFKRQLPDGVSLVRAAPGDRYEVSNGDYRLPLTEPEAVARLLAELDDRAFRADTLVYVCQAQGAEGEIYTDVRALFTLCKALLLRRLTAPVQLVVVHPLQGKNVPPQHAALAAFLKTLTAENSLLTTKNICLPGSRNLLAKSIPALFAEMADRQPGAADIRHVWLREEDVLQRQVADLAAFTPSNSVPPLRQGGVYLITGGLGGLGYLFAEYLVRDYDARLVLVGRSPENTAIAEKLAHLSSLSKRDEPVTYIAADVTDADSVAALVAKAKALFGAIHGVIHSAGTTRDDFILNKSVDDLAAVIEPKVVGVEQLDRALAAEPLDLFVVFSSLAGALGNPGQCDYAYANAYLDNFAARRHGQVVDGERFGKTLAINWPFWLDGGMSMSEERISLTHQKTGMQPLPTLAGIDAWQRLIGSGVTQALVFYGDQAQMAAYLSGADVAVPVVDKALPQVDNLDRKTEAYLRQTLGSELKLAPEKIELDERFDVYGVDSVVINRFNAQLESDLGELPKTLLYEYETIADLAQYLLTHFHDVLVRHLGGGGSAAASDVEPSAPVADAVKVEGALPVDVKPLAVDEKIAIVGMSGRYPGAKNLDEFWQKLAAGENLVREVPAERWDAEAFYDADPEQSRAGKIYCKWGGFIEDCDQFDPGFFSISADEARLMDPQERLFMASVWLALEDAGYTRDALKKAHPKGKSADVGVFVGVTSNTYQTLAPDLWRQGTMVTPGAMPWSIANRVSYFFDFQGPSIPVDTACSSSLVALHMAMQSLRGGECQLAIAGGVNLYLHPAKYHAFCQKRMVAHSDRNRSFGAGDDGFVPGEGVGVLVLKPLARAEQDGDHIHGVIAGSAFEHSGRANGYSAPNPNAQAAVIARTLQSAGLTPEDINFVEGHGTGTQLGDALEISALHQVFSTANVAPASCAISSVKSNIGHGESAAGVAGIAKILLQMKHQLWVPSLHAEDTNPNIQWDGSPFVLQRKVSTWPTVDDKPRRALINSFGAGGVNACVVLEEHRRPAVSESSVTGPYLLVLSARTEKDLRASVSDIVHFAQGHCGLNMADVCFTLQTGREAFSERLAVVVKEQTDLIEILNAWQERGVASPCLSGTNVPPSKKPATAEQRQRHRQLFDEDRLNELAQCWVQGESIDWQSLYQLRPMPHRIPLPGYPFAGERYWVTDFSAVVPVEPTAGAAAALHPLISQNVSTLRNVRFSSTLRADAYYAQDHRIAGQALFPGTGFIEMAIMAGNLAGEQSYTCMRDIVWMHPLRFSDTDVVADIRLKTIGNDIEYEITSLNDDCERVVHSEGRLLSDLALPAGACAPLSLESLKEAAYKRTSGEQFYALFAQMGFDYRARFRTLESVYHGEEFVLAKLKLHASTLTDFDQYRLHPCLLDGALQAVLGLAMDAASDASYVPFALDQLDLIRPLVTECYALVQRSDDGRASEDMRKFNIRILDTAGQLLLKLSNFYLRALTPVPIAAHASDTAVNPH